MSLVYKSLSCKCKINKKLYNITALYILLFIKLKNLTQGISNAELLHRYMHFVFVKESVNNVNNKKNM